MTLDTGVDYGAMDNKSSDLFFMIAAPMDGDLHLEILSRLMVLLMDGDFTAKLRAATTVEEFMKAIDEAEGAKYGEPPRRRLPLRKRLPVTVCWLLPPAPPALLTPTWLPRLWRRPAKPWISP